MPVVLHPSRRKPGLKQTGFIRTHRLRTPVPVGIAHNTRMRCSVESAATKRANSVLVASSIGAIRYIFSAFSAPRSSSHAWMLVSH
jgi:hypothetical protein